MTRIMRKQAYSEQLQEQQGPYLDAIGQLCAIAPHTELREGIHGVGGRFGEVWAIHT